MASSVIGAVAGPVIGGIFGGKNADKQAAATRDAAAMADPFRSQRGMYQGILSNLYGGMAGAGGGMAPSGSGAVGNIAQGMISGKNGQRIGNFFGNRAPTAPVSANAGTASSGSSIMDFIRSSPDYQFRMQEGQRALERSASAKGLLGSGNLLRDLVTFGQGQASSAYESEINRIMTMAGATVGSPGVAGQIAGKAAEIQAGGRNQLMGGIGYGIGQLAQNWNTGTTANSMIQGQTGYTGGAAGVLSGDEWANW